MAIVKVFTDNGQEVTSIEVDDNLSDQAKARYIIGTLQQIHGWLGRALEDARIIQQGGDPERASEKTMRLLAERDQDK